MEAFAVFGQLFEQMALVVDVFRYVWFFLLPPVLYYVFRFLWTNYIVNYYFDNVAFDIIEIIPPRNTERSPQPMELVYAGIQGVFKGFNAYEELCEGQSTAPFSFEIVGTGGQVHFYILCQSNYRGIVESNLYAQYPDIEIIDLAQDYVESVPAIVPNQQWNLWGSDLELVAPDPVPIKTWENFEEDITGKMIDPLAGLIELMGRARRGEHLWLQFVTTPVKETSYNSGKEYADTLKGKEVQRKKSVLGRAVMAMTGFLSTDHAATKDESPLEFRLSPGEKKVLEAVEENIGRYMFKTKMRMVYTGRKEVFDGQIISGFFGALKQFADFNLNSFKPDNVTKTKADFIFRKTRLRYKQRQILDRYRKRSMMGKTFMLSDRELATVYHMPDMTVAAPSIARSATTKSSAPANLPIGE